MTPIRIFSMLLPGFLFLSAASVAQVKKPGFTVGVYATYAQPKSDLYDAYSAGPGAEIKAGIGFGKTYLIASAGYNAFISRSNNHEGTLTYQPVRFGVKQYFLAKRLFINGDIGFATLKNKTMPESQKRLAADIGVGARLLGIEAGIYVDAWQHADGSPGLAHAVVYKLGFNLTL